MINYVEREHTNPDGTVVKILCHPDFDPAQPVDETDR